MPSRFIALTGAHCRCAWATQRDKVNNEQAIYPVIQDMQHELAAARCHYPSIDTIHEGYAIILEEMDEFWYQVKKSPNARDPHLLYHELIQIAAMCLRTADDRWLMDDSMGLRYADERNLGG